MLVLPAFLLVVAIGGYLHIRGHDIRLILFAAAAAMFVLRGIQPEMSGHRFDLFGDYFLGFARGMTDPNSVVPICSAMGFAYVCKYTRCDAHLVHLLISPLRHIHFLLIPGGIAVAFIVNSAIVSQTSTVSVVGPVLIPLLLAGGVSRRTAGALLLLGGSMGGELLNPAAVEVTNIKAITKLEAVDIVHKILPYNLIASGTALLVFWLMSFRWNRLEPQQYEDEVNVEVQPGSIAAMMNSSDAEPIERVNILKALVPLVPILLLLFVKPNIPLPQAFVNSGEYKMGEQTAIAAAMLIGVTVAALVTRRNLDRIVAAFFEGAGFTFMYVIPVIAGASMFAQGVEMNGLIKMIADRLHAMPAIITLAAIAIGWLMAMLTGTAVGTAPLVIRMMLPIAMTGAATPQIATQAGTKTGALAAIAAQFGRTASPVAPVTIMCATLSKNRPMALVKRVMVPLLAGAFALLLAAMFWR